MGDMRKLLAALVAVSAVAPVWSQAEEGAEKILGTIAVVTKGVGIYAQKSSDSRRYFPATAGMPLVIQRVEDPWAGVMMSDGRVGWVKIAFIQLTDKVAVLAAQDSRDQIPTSRAGFVVKRALDLTHDGVPYVWGGNSLTDGVDCSGLVKRLYGEIGKNLPRTARDQALVGTPIKKWEDLRGGDRIYFWNASRTKISHTGIFVGEPKNGDYTFVHSARSRGGIVRDRLNDSRWLRTLAGVMR